MTTTGPTGAKLGPYVISSRFGLKQSWGIEAYLAHGGYEGLRKALAMTPEDVHQAALASSILGRGGAGFDAGRKWGMLRKAKPDYLVVNGDESEPATFKDHAIMEGDPHQLIEGIVTCAYAIGADQVFLYVRGEMALAHERLQAALNEAYDYGAVGRNILGLGFFGRHRHPPRRRRRTYAVTKPRCSRAWKENAATRASSPRSTRRLWACTGPPRSSTTSRRFLISRGSCATAVMPSRRWAKAAPGAPRSCLSPATSAGQGTTKSSSPS